MSKKKLKAVAEVYVPQSRDACAADIRALGDLQRDRDRVTADMNDEIAAITAKAQPTLDALQADIDRFFKGVQSWCEANRAQITDNLRVKTANLITGEVVWRVNNPSCSVRGEATVMATLKALQLQAFIRTDESINKELIIATTQAARNITDDEAKDDPQKAETLKRARALASVPGLRVVTGVESFSVVPFEQEVA